VHWLAETATRRGSEATGSALSNLPWLLANRGGERGFKLSRDVLDHPGAEVLQHEFWVVGEKIPPSLATWVQTNRLTGTRQVLEGIARCLASSASAVPQAVHAVYELLTELTTDVRAGEAWREIARSTPVYRL